MPNKPITFSIVDDDPGLRDSIIRYLTVKGVLSVSANMAARRMHWPDCRRSNPR